MSSVETGPPGTTTTRSPVRAAKVSAFPLVSRKPGSPVLAAAICGTRFLCEKITKCAN